MTATLDHAGIARRIPHQGCMCLLDRLEGWTADAVHCSATGHGDPTHPMRTRGGLLAPCAIEYAAQAMALHGALVAESLPGGGPAAPTPGFIASVRGVRFGVERLDTVEGALQVFAERLSGDDRQVLYAFRLTDAADRLLAEGRAVVVLNTPLAARPAVAGTGEITT
jgi:predicted hotdog family 3-hydroxylacyl-ACP dehydratase